MALDIQHLSHLVVRVNDIAASRAFYAGVIGLKHLYELALPGGSGTAVGLLTPTGVTVELLQLLDGQGKPVPVNGSADTTMMAFTVPDLEAARARLAAQGITTSDPMEIEGLRLVFVPDPDGRNVELAQLPASLKRVADMHAADWQL